PTRGVGELDLKVLIISQVFIPDMSANALLCGSLARYLTSEGHEVTVLAGPRMEIVDTDSRESGSFEGITVNRPAAGVYRKSRGLLARLSSFLRLYLSVVRAAFRRRNFDIVLVLTTPP